MNSNFIKFNKSQIGIFVVIALIIVSMGIFYFTKNSDSINFFVDKTPAFKVSEYVKNCLDVETTDAINKIGLNGGWLYHPPLRFINRKTNEFRVKSGAGLEMFNIKSPYWYYFDDSSNSFKYNIPEFDSKNKYSIKTQIKTYIDSNLDKKCLKGFKAYKDVYKIDYKPKKISTSVEFNGEDIKVGLKLPLTILEINKNVTDYVDTFRIKTINKLYVPYYLARDIIYSESKSSFVEKRILQFLTPYQSSVGRNLLPPFYDFRLVYDFAPWRVSDVKKLTKEIISSNLNLIQFYSTKSKQINLPAGLESNAFAKGVYGAYTKDYLSENSLIKKDDSKLFSKFKNYKINSVFESFFPMDFKLSPSLGNVILLPKPTAMLNILPIFFTTYSSVYEMHMPILFEIKDSRNPNDKFVFNLAMEANIDYNAPLKDKKDYGFNLSALPTNFKSLVCDPSQFISDYVYLNISDPIEHGNRKSSADPIKGVDGAIVSFNCKGIASCYVGQTKINGLFTSENLTRLQFRLPNNCNPGSLKISKFGYKTLKFNNLNPKINSPINLGEAKMYSLKEVNLKINLLETKKSIYSLGRGLNKYEKGFLILTNKEDKDLTQVIEFNKKTENKLKVKLVPGTYSIEAFVIYENNVTIGDKQFCYNKGFFSGSTCQIIPGFTAKSWVSGSLEVTKYDVTLSDLFNKNTFVVNIIDMPLPTNYDDLTNMVSDIKSVSNNKKPYFENN